MSKTSAHSDRTIISDVSTDEVVNQGKEAYPTVTQEILNYTGKPVTIIDRHGQVVTHPPLKQPYRVPGVLIINRLKGKVFFNSYASYSDEDVLHHSPVLAQMVKQAELTTNPNDFSEVVYKQFVSLVQLSKQEHLNGVYVSDLDLIMKLNAYDDNTVSHPASWVGTEEAYAPRPRGGIDKCTGVTYTLIDNSGSALNDKYCVLNGNVYRIERTKDPNLTDGLYITTRGDTGNASLINTKRIPVEELDEYIAINPVLYHTYEDAKNLGDPAAQRDREHELEKLRREHDNTKAKLDLTEKELKAKKEELDRKQNYQAFDHKLKTQQSIVKYIPAIITGIFAAAIAIMKLF